MAKMHHKYLYQPRPRGESIAGMKFFGRHLHEGASHLTWTIFFRLVGIDAAISTGLTYLTGCLEHSILATALPLPFYLLLFVVIFLGLAIFYAVTMRFRMPPKVRIISAFYGNSAENEVSVVEYLKAYPRNALALQVDNNLLDGLPDPAPCILPKKILTVRYSFGNDTVWETSRGEGEWLTLPDLTDQKRKIS